MTLETGYLVAESPEAGEVRLQLEANGYAVEYWSAGPGAVLAGLQLQADGILYVDCGTGLVSLGEEEVEVAPGDRVLVPQGMPHTLRNHGDGPLTWLAAVRILVE